MYKIVQHSIFIIKVRYLNKWSAIPRNLWYKSRGMYIGKRTYLPKIYVTWPHQVFIGTNCRLEHGVYFKYDGIWSKGPSIIVEDEVFIGSFVEFNCNCLIRIGKYSNIASGCRFIDHDHGTNLGSRIGPQPSIKKEIIVGEDVWIGANSVILKGVNIGSGSVIAAGAIVTKSIPSNEIWGGVPAKLIRVRN